MGYNEWSDDETTPRNHGRDKFRHERSLERDLHSGEEHDRYDRKKRGRRSPTPPEDRRQNRKPSFSPSPMRNYHGRIRNYRTDPDTDHYIPNYDRDGYKPGPRYGNKPEASQPPSFTNNSKPGPGVYPMIEMMNPQMINQGWPGNVGRFPSVDPTQLDYLVPFKQFVDFTKRTTNRRIDDEEMQKRFAQYKEKFTARQWVQFFNANKDKEWFQEKYHPAVSRPRLESIKERRLSYFKDFLQQLEKGVFDDIRYDKNSNTNHQEPNEEDEAELSENTEEGQNADFEKRLVIKTVPPTISREKIIKLCQTVEGFDYLALSEPSPSKKFHRIGWISFKEDVDIKKAFEQLDNQKVDDFAFHLAMNRKCTPQARVPRLAPDVTNMTDRLKKDLEQARELAIVFETFLGDECLEGLKAVEDRAQLVISQHVTEEKKENQDEEKGLLSEEEEDAEKRKLKKKLDLIIAYLRKVHMYCYYCGLECDSLEELSRKCSDPHYRTVSNNSSGESNDPKQAAKNERGVAQWAKNLDQKISLKIHTPDDHELKKLGGKVIQTEIDNYIKEHVLKEHDSKYKCQVGECSKAFKGFDYVEKHIIAKHPEEIERIKTDAEYLNNYICDPNHIVPNTTHQPQPQPIMNMPFVGSNPPYMMHHQNMRLNNGLPPPVMVGTPWDQIPRIGFGADPAGWAARRPRIPPNNSAIMDLENSLPKDPRQVKSYVDLDAPAEGDSNISFY